MKRFLMRWLTAALTFGFLLLSGYVDNSLAATFCVSSFEELEAALSAAQTNSQADEIHIVQGNYSGNFVYASTESFGITIEGGYTDSCAAREVDAENTILDGSGNSNVLVLSSDQVVDFKATYNG